MLRHSDLVTSPGSPFFFFFFFPPGEHGRVPIAVGATARARAGGGSRERGEKIQPVKGRVIATRTFRRDVGLVRGDAIDVARGALLCPRDSPREEEFKVRRFRHCNDQTTVSSVVRCLLRE